MNYSTPSYINENKQRVLQKEFELIDVNHDQVVTKSELYNYLDQKLGGRQFDRNVADQLFERMDKNHDGTVNITEFINVFQEAEEVLKNKIENSKKYLEEYSRSRREAANKLEEVRAIETYNQYNIMEGSLLTVSVVEAQLQNRDKQVYCTLVCGDQQQQFTKKGYGQNPQWNDDFTFQIISGQEILQIIVVSQEDQQDDYLGAVQIPMNSLRDQNKHDELYDLYDQQQRIGIGKIKLSLQWLYSRVKYLTDVVRKWDENIKNQDDDLNDYQRDLNTILEPFQLLQRYYRGDTSVLNATPMKLNAQSIPPVQNQLYQSRHEQQKQAGNIEGQQQYQIYIENLKQTNFAKFFMTRDECFYHRICVAAILIFSIFICFGKAQFIDLIFAVTFLILNYDTFTDKAPIKNKYWIYFTAIIVVSVFLDLFWLVIYTNPWWNAKGKVYEAEKSLKRFIIVFTILLFIVKIVTSVLFIITTAQKTNVLGQSNLNQQQNNPQKYSQFNDQQQQRNQQQPNLNYQIDQPDYKLQYNSNMYNQNSYNRQYQN